MKSLNTLYIYRAYYLKLFKISCFLFSFFSPKKLVEASYISELCWFTKVYSVYPPGHHVLFGSHKTSISGIPTSLLELEKPLE